MATWLLDWESRSRAKLTGKTAVGGRNYWEHPTTEPICCTLWDVDTGREVLWLPGDPCPVNRDDTLGAHNMSGFDRFACAKVWHMPWLLSDDGRGYIDTSELARRAGLPGSLDALARRWLGQQKDDAGTAIIRALSGSPVTGDSYFKGTTKLKKRGVPAALLDELRAYGRESRKLAPGFAPIPFDTLSRTVEYNGNDVGVLKHGWPLLREWLDVGWENDVSRVDRLANNRGIRLDIDLIKRLLEEDERNAYMACEAIARDLGTDEWSAERVRKAANSPKEFSAITGAPNAQAATIEAILADPDSSKVARGLAKARQAIASIARGKLTKMLCQVSPDGRLRDSLRYIGAHTWRWSHRGPQLGNMPRPHGRYEEWGDAEICRLADAVKAGQHATQDEIDLLLRACIIASDGCGLAVCDFSGVEARANAWAANDPVYLDIFTGKLRDKNGKALDSYKITASQGIYKIPYDEVTKPQRQAGKVADLACGYGGGRGALLNMAKGMGIDLDAAGVDPQVIVDGWRELHAPIKQSWYDYERAFIHAAHGEASRVACFDFCPGDDGSVAIFMPSGRPIIYNGVEVTRGYKGRPQISYEGLHDESEEDDDGDATGEKTPLREKLYGGLLCENVIQAFCRDLMADAWIRAEDAGLPVVLTVHDEIVCEVPREAMKEGYEVLHDIMCDLPEWAEGFPVGASGHYGERYRK